MSPLGDGRVGYIQRHTGPIGWSLSVTSAGLLPARKIRLFMRGSAVAVSACHACTRTSDLGVIGDSRDSLTCRWACVLPPASVAHGTADSVRTQTDLIAWDIAPRRPGSVCGRPSCPCQRRPLLHASHRADMRRFRHHAGCRRLTSNLPRAQVVHQASTGMLPAGRVAAISEDHYLDGLPGPRRGSPGPG